MVNIFDVIAGDTCWCDGIVSTCPVLGLWLCGPHEPCDEVLCSSHHFHVLHILASLPFFRIHHFTCVPKKSDFIKSTVGTKARTAGPSSFLYAVWHYIISYVMNPKMAKTILYFIQKEKRTKEKSSSHIHLFTKCDA